ncbi:MAG: alcohol dehydrogenase catalytic domain-containing protein [Gammaproteobacteria bacterium]|nr:alcohol dehydrogenase catalytic domain-containing protein [Gammaproteobacteria bacterium]
MREAEIPAPAADECLVQVSHSGICGTDLKIFQGEIPVGYPLIMGHEMAGTLVQAPASLPPASGSRVIVDPGLFCGACFHCRAGQTNLCPNGGLIGRDSDGGFAEYLRVPARNVFALPDEITDNEAPLLQVLSTCVHARRLAPASPDETVVVTGLGVTGQLHVQLAKASGAFVIGITRSQWKRELAEQLGADVTLAPGDDLEERVLAVSDGRGADLVIETVGSVPLLAQAIDLVRIGGRLLTFGIYTAEKGTLPFYQTYFKELKIINSRASRGRDFPASLDLVRRGVVQLAPLISHTLTLAELDQALALLSDAAPQRMKIIIDNTSG